MSACLYCELITQRILSEILLNQTEIRLYLPVSDWFETKPTSVWLQINRKLVNIIRFQFDLISFLCVCIERKRPCIKLHWLISGRKKVEILASNYQKRHWFGPCLWIMTYKLEQLKINCEKWENIWLLDFSPKVKKTYPNLI